MKSKPLRPTPRRRQAMSKCGALLAALALGAWSTVPLQAEVISNFDAPSWTWEDDPSAKVTFPVADGQLKITAPFTQPTDPAAAANTYAGVGWSKHLFPTTSQTLELRVDLISASQDDVFVFLGWEASANPAEGYWLMADRNEIGLMKFHGDHRFSFPLWESMPTIEGPVTLALRLTRTGDGGLSLLITTTVMERGSGAVLYHRSFLDTPAADPVVPTPGPHGILSRVPEPGRAYVGGGTDAMLGIWHITDGKQPPAELILDNFEYRYCDAPVLDIEKAVLLSWPQHTAEEQIVLGAASIDGPWVPWLEPTFRRQGELCTAVPITFGEQWRAPEQYFKLAPGYQFRDDFSDPTRPWTACFPDPRKFEISYADGALRVAAPTPGAYSRAILIPFGYSAPDPFLHADFSMAVDILDWFGRGDWVEVGLVARATPPPDCARTLNSYVYIAGFAFGRSGAASISIYANPPNAALKEMSVNLDPNKAYRLSFSGVGSQLVLRLFDLANPGEPVAELKVANTTLTHGVPALWFDADTGAYDVTLDNFIVTGTTP